MKIILSRKGFDSSYGDGPSPIFPDGKMISFPIPDEKAAIKYSDLKIDNNKTYLDLIKELELKEGLEDTCHLDPDIYREVLDRKEEWRPLFGQIGAAQSHLENQHVKEGDLFLFFGTFRETNFQGEKLRFERCRGEIHAIFGYFQIGDIIKTSKKSLFSYRKPSISPWMTYHPHVEVKERFLDPLNTLYIAKPHLSWNPELPGAAPFYFNNELKLTMKGKNKSRWELPSLFKNVNITYHSPSSWKDEYFQSTHRGQEFVIEEKEEIEDWAKSLINKSRIIEDL